MNDNSVEMERKNCLTEGRVMPSAVEVERAVLGVMMVERDAVARVAGEVTAECFYTEAHREIFRVIMELDGEGRPVDLLTVADRMGDNEVLRGDGGVAYLAMLTSRASGAVNVEAWARIIREKHVARRVIETCGRVMAMAYDGAEDLEEVMGELNRGVDEVNEEVAGGAISRDLRTLVGVSMREYEKRAENGRKGVNPGVPTGLQGLDELTGGWKGGQLVVIGARPSMGKTAMALHLVKMAARSGVPSCVYSLEMDDVSLTNRMLLSECDVDKRRFRDGELTEEELRRMHEAAGRLEKLPVYIDDRPAVTMGYIRNHARVMKKRGRCGMIVVDYLQLAGGVMTGKEWSWEREVAQMSRAAKMMAKELGVPFILLSQLNRDVEKRPDKRPQLSDLRESGAIEQDADVIAFLYRPAVYGIREITWRKVNIGTEGLGVVIVAKQRDGEMGSVLFRHNRTMTRFEDYDPSWGKEDDKRPF